MSNRGLHILTSNISISVAYAGFSKGGGRKFENNEDQKKNFSTQNQSVFLPKIRWRPKKKALHSKLVRFLAQNWMNTKNNRSLPSPFVCSNFLPKFQRGGKPQFCVLFYVIHTILATQKGGAWYHAPLLNIIRSDNTTWVYPKRRKATDQAKFHDKIEVVRSNIILSIKVIIIVMKTYLGNKLSLSIKKQT